MEPYLSDIQEELSYADSPVDSPALSVPRPLPNCTLPSASSELLQSLKKLTYFEVSKNCLLRLRTPAEVVVDRATIEKYSTLACLNYEAHLHKLTFMAHYLAYDCQPQALILAGLSGSGKSDCFWQILTYLGHRFSNQELFSRLLDVKFLLDSFGTAKTEETDCATQYGQLLDLYLDFQGDLVGFCNTYLPINRWLNNPRTGSSKFQIFYLLLTGADLSLLKSLKLQRNPAKYALLKFSCKETLTPEGRRKTTCLKTLVSKTDSKSAFESYHRIVNGLKALDLDVYTVPIFQILSAILKLSNLNFRPDFKLDGTPTCSLEHELELFEIAELLGCDCGDLLHAIQSRDVSAEETGHVVEVLCRTLYGRLFHWLLTEINKSATVKPSQKVHNDRILSIFDCYGLDTAGTSSAKSHFERYLVNYVNELIRDFFIRQNLKLEQEILEKEEIEWIWVPFQDFSPTNAVCLSFLMLDNSETDREFLDILSMSRSETQGTHRRAFDPLLCLGNSSLLVSHYGGNYDLEYNLGDFVEKNREFLPPAVPHLMFTAQNPLCRILFPEGNANRQTIKPLSSSAQLETSTNLILQSLYTKECSWVICINPGQDFNEKQILSQMRAFCIPELQSLNSKFYCHQSFEYWHHRFRTLSPLTWPGTVEPSATSVSHILQACCFSKSAYTIGKTRLFLKSSVHLVRLETLRRRRLGFLAKTIQQAYRSYKKSCKTEPTLQQCQARLAAYCRGFKDRRELKERHAAATKIQAWYKACKTRAKVAEYRQLKAKILISDIFWRFVCYRYLKGRLAKLPPLSPRADVWSRVPYDSIFLETDEYLKYLYHRWRCHKYRASVDQHQYYRMREKLTASLIFGTQKQSYPATVAHPFQGDYVRIRHNSKWKRIALETNDEYVVFADVIGKVNRSSGKVSQSMLVASTAGVALLDHRSLQLRYRVPVNAIQKISVSPYNDNVGIFHLKNASLTKSKGDFLFECRHLIELVAKLYLVIQNATGKPPTVDVLPSVRVQFEDERLEMIFRPAIEADPISGATTGCFHKPSVAPSSSLGALTCYGESPDLPSQDHGGESNALDQKGTSSSAEHFRSHAVKYARKGDTLEVYV